MVVGPEWTSALEPGLEKACAFEFEVRKGPRGGWWLYYPGMRAAVCGKTIAEIALKIDIMSPDSGLYTFRRKYLPPCAKTKKAIMDELVRLN